jgi:NTE family protein
MIAFVLAGGASLGAIEAGMLRALYERNIAPELIVGTSAGALNGAYIASRSPTVQTATTLAMMWRATDTLKVFPPNPLTALAGLVGARDYLVSNSGVKRLLRENAQFTRMEDAAISFHVIATDVLDGREVRLSRGDAESAVVASAAIPGVFPSIERDGLTLVDGGVADNTPISHAVELGADTIYVLPTGAPCALKQPPRGAIQMLVHAISLLINERLARDIDRYSGRVELIVLPPPCPQPVLPSDFDHAEELIQQGYELARQALDEPRTWSARALDRLRPHDHGAA